METQPSSDAFISPLHVKRVERIAQEGTRGDEILDELVRLNQVFFSEMERHRRAIAAIHEEDYRLNLEDNLDPSLYDLSDPELYIDESEGYYEEEDDDVEEALGIPHLRFQRSPVNSIDLDGTEGSKSERLTKSTPSSPIIGANYSISPPGMLLNSKEKNQSSNRIAQDRANFLRAALQLADDMEGTSTRKSSAIVSLSKVKDEEKPVIREGYLKKQHNKYWKIKSCCLKTGVFFYVDERTQTTFGPWEGKKKSIELISGLVYCKPYESAPKGNREKDEQEEAKVFEISYIKGPQRVFMAKDAAERDQWVKDIKGAMIPPTEKKHREPTTIEYEDSEHINDIKRFLKIRKRLCAAQNIEQYKAALKETIEETLPASASAAEFKLTIPVQWVREEIENEAWPPRGLQLEQLYKDMRRDRIVVNNIEITGEDHSLEAMVGQVMGAIITKATQASAFPIDPRNRLSEKDALKTARDVLLAANRTQSGGDTYLCVLALCQPAESELVVICPTARIADPMKIDVKGIQELDLPEERCPIEERRHRGNMSSGSEFNSDPELLSSTFQSALLYSMQPWECTSCTLQNKSEREICAVCENKRPEIYASKTGEPLPIHACSQRARTEVFARSPMAKFQLNSRDQHRRINSEPAVSLNVLPMRPVENSQSETNTPRQARETRSTAHSDHSLPETEQGLGIDQCTSDSMASRGTSKNSKNTLIVRIQVTAKTSYRIVHLGDTKAHTDDNLIIVECEFQQQFNMHRNHNKEGWVYTYSPELPVVQIKFEDAVALIDEETGS